MHKRFIPLALAWVGDEDSIDGRTRLQKMVFVVQQELKDSGVIPEDQLYEFFAYDYGPFSKELAEDLDQMIDTELIDEKKVEYDEDGNVKYLYTLEENGREVVEAEVSGDDISNVIDTVERIKRRFNDELSLPEVLDEVYSQYPEYAKNSVY